MYRFTQKLLYALVVLMTLYCTIYAQTSPSPVVTGFNGAALDSAFALSDSTFCKGSVLTIEGTDFVSLGPGEIWDSMTVWLDGYYFGQQCELVNLNAGNNNNSNDQITVKLPDGFVNDTCLVLDMAKHCSGPFGPINYFFRDTVCLTGDVVQLSYTDTVFCVGDSNPLPDQLFSTSVFSFCCVSGTAGFMVLPTGEVPLHSGAIGLDQSFALHGSHPACPDTAFWSLDILAQNSSLFSMQGGINSFCPFGTAMADTSLIFPKGGRFVSHFSGLVVSNDTIGLLDLSLCVPGTYDLWYLPSEPCYDSSSVSITIFQPDTANVVYPIAYQGNYQRLCPYDPPVNPIFLSGNAGGDFTALPMGLSLSSTGTIDPANSPAGHYTIMYTTNGNCPDTATASLNLQIDTILDPFFSLTDSVCSSVPALSAANFFHAGTWAVLLADSVLYASNIASIPIYNTLSPGFFEVQHLTTGYCPDTFSQTLTVLLADNGSFSYNPNFYCLGDADPLPIVTGNGGGIFSGVDSFTIVNSYGRVDLDVSGLGIHQIQYITNGICPDTTFTFLSVVSSPDAFFLYPQAIFCSGDTLSVPVVNSSGGLFSAGSGLVMDSLDGEIDLAQSVPGIYTVTYAFTGSCQTSFAQTVSVQTSDSSTSIDYEMVYCADSVAAVPLFMGDNVGTFVASAGLVFLNPLAGSIDLINSVTGGPYVVIWDVQNPCAVDPVDTFYIEAAPIVNLAYGQESVCQGAAPLIVALGPSGIDSLGSFYAPSGLSLDASGTVDPAQSQPGSYSIEFTTSGHCQAMASTNLTIHPKPSNLELQLYPDSAICEGEMITALLSSSDGISYEWLLNDSLIDSLGYVLQSDAFQNEDHLTGVVKNTWACRDSIATSFLVSPKPVIGLDFPTGNISSDGRYELDLLTNVNQSVINWHLWQLGQVVDSSRVLADSGIWVGIRPQTNQIPDFEREALQLQVSARSGTCVGDTVLYELLLQNEPFFIPEVITPDGNGQNDRWEIKYDGSVDPAAFSLSLFNRAGARVHYQDAVDNRFAGGALPDGVYWWVLQKDDKEVQTGGLTIKRK